MKKRSEMISVYLEEIGDDKDVLFIFKLCPFMKYLKIECINTMNIQLFLRIILTINKCINDHLRSLCLHVGISNEQILENIEEMIKCEKVLPRFTIKHVFNGLCTMEMTQIYCFFFVKFIH